MSKMTKKTRLPYKVRHIPIKRIFDIFFSLCILVLGLPLFLFIAAIVFITSPGKIIYSHERVGRGGRTFRCYKFRSMYPDADSRLKDLLKKDPEKLREWRKSYQTQKRSSHNTHRKYLTQNIYG